MESRHKDLRGKPLAGKNKYVIDDEDHACVLHATQQVLFSHVVGDRPRKYQAQMKPLGRFLPQ
jgi:hypothetical protein